MLRAFTASLNRCDVKASNSAWRFLLISGSGPDVAVTDFATRRDKNHRTTQQDSDGTKQARTNPLGEEVRLPLHTRGPASSAALPG
jgi:hypothetical protein